MLDWLYWTAVGLALVGLICARRDHWAAAPLLASAAFCFVARWQGWPFRLWLWVAVDLAVIAAIVWPLIPLIRARAWRWLLLAYRREVVVLALFAPALVAYALPDHPAHVLSTVVATTQLLATVPWRQLGRQCRRTLHRAGEWSHFDLRVAPA
jgi:hypothetical protein